MKAHTPLNIFIIKYLKKGKNVTERIIAKRESYLVANWKENLAYHAIHVRTRRTRLGRQPAQHEPVHSSSSSNEEDRQSEENVSASREDEVEFVANPTQQLSVV